VQGRILAIVALSDSHYTGLTGIADDIAASANGDAASPS
jgi:hypothetical protein